MKKIYSDYDCFVYTKYHKKIKMTYITEFYRYEDSELVFIGTKQFGTSDLFVMFTVAELRALSKIIANMRDIFYETNSEDRDEYNAIFYRGAVDTPIEIGVNAIKSQMRFISIDLISIIDLIAFDRLVNGSNIWYEKNLLDVNNQFYITIRDDDSTHISMDSFIRHSEWADTVQHPQSIYLLNNKESDCTVFDEVYYYIPELNMYQRLSVKKYQRLNSLDSLTIQYSLFDSPQCFSEVYRISEYYAHNISDILCSAVCIASDFYYSAILEAHERPEPMEIVGRRFLHDGFHFELVSKSFAINLDITSYELGLRTQDGIFIREEFSLLQFIDRIIKLRINL